MTPEGRVKALVKRKLAKLSRLYSFMPVQNGMGAPGLDFFLCAGGWFIAIETKAPGKKLTPRQETTRDQILDAHGLVYVVDDEASCDVAMEVIAACCKLADVVRVPGQDGPADRTRFKFTAAREPEYTQERMSGVQSDIL